jgi:hypothetical protein
MNGLMNVKTIVITLTVSKIESVIVLYLDLPLQLQGISPFAEVILIPALRSVVV